MALELRRERERSTGSRRGEGRGPKVFKGWGLETRYLDEATESVCSDRDRWVNFMMREELQLSKPAPRRARVSALTIGGSYVAGGAIPLAPYLFHVPITTALAASVGVTLLALAVFGAFKGRLTGRPPGGEALRTVLVGALASGAAYALARLISAETASQPCHDPLASWTADARDPVRHVET